MIKALSHIAIIVNAIMLGGLVYGHGFGIGDSVVLGVVAWSTPFNMITILEEKR